MGAPDTARPRWRLRRTILLCGLLLVAGIGVTWALVRQAALDLYRDQLQATAVGQAQLIESVARFDARTSPTFPGGSSAATVQQVRDALHNWPGFGETGELVVIFPDDWSFITSRPDTIRRHRHPCPLCERGFAGETGTTIDTTADGRVMLAAYTPVGELDLVLVARIELWEVERPLLISLAGAGGLGLVLIALAGWLIRQQWRPAVQAIAASESDLRDIVRLAPYPLMVHASDGETLMFSDAWLQQTGYTAEDLPSVEEWVRRAAPDDLPLVGERLEKLHATRTLTDHGEFVIRTATGAMRTWKFNSAPLTPLPDGRHRVVSMGVDLTETRRREALARSVIDSLAAHVAVIDSTGQILLVNSAWDDFGRRSGAEHRAISAGADYLRTFAAEAASNHDAARATEGIRAVLGQTIAHFSMEYPCHSPERDRWFRMTVTPLVGGDGAVIAHEDITDRKQAMIDLEMSRSLLDRTQATAEIGGWEVDASTGGVSWTEVTHHLLGLGPDDPRGMPTIGAALDRFAPDAPMLRSIVERVVVDGGRFDQEVAVAHTSGRRFWARIRGEAETRDGQVERLVGTVEDIDRRKRAELALHAERQHLARRVDEQTEALRAANAELRHAMNAKDQFLATMSHELRTPLNGIIVLAESLHERVFGSLSDQQQTCVDGIHESADHLLNLINDILDVSTVEAGMLSIEPAVTPVDRVCTASLALVRDLARRKGLELQYESPTDNAALPSHLMIDQRRIKQVLVNLLSNAVKFTESGHVRLALAVENGMFEFAVSDTGVGIPPGQISRLFQPFSQVDESLSRRHEGTGLGLVIVDRLTQLHGGEVTVESEPGTGSTFRVRLPLATVGVGDGDSHGDPDGWSTTSASAAGEAFARLLLAEDNELNRRSTAQYLSARGYKVSTATTGLEALERTIDERPDVLLLDLQMPGMDGLQLVKRLREHDPPVPTRVIALTAMAMPGDRQRCLDVGCDDYLAKPVSLSALRRVIDTWVGHPRH